MLYRPSEVKQHIEQYIDSKAEEYIGQIYHKMKQKCSCTIYFTVENINKQILDKIKEKLTENGWNVSDYESAHAKKQVLVQPKDKK